MNAAAAAMAACLALGLVLVLSAGEASARSTPATPKVSSSDEYLGLLLWAQDQAEHPTAGPRREAVPTAERLAAFSAAWREQHKGLFSKEKSHLGATKKPAPPLKKVVTPKPPAPARTPAPTPTTPVLPPVPATDLTPPTLPPYPARAPSFVDGLFEGFDRPHWPSHEEYDRSERFSHSFLHGFRSF